MSGRKEIPLADFEVLPEKLGFRFPELRIQLNSIESLKIRRGVFGVESIVLLNK